MHRFRWLVGIFFILLLWWIVISIGIINPVFLPPPGEVLSALSTLLISNSLTPDIIATTFRTLAGFIAGTIVGVIGGLMIGSYRKAYEIMEFPIDFFRSIPATAIFPLFIAIWGVGDQSKIFITAWASSMVVLVNTIYGVKNTSSVLLTVAKLKKLSPIKTYIYIRLPAAITHIVAGMRTALSFALIVQIVAEMFLGSNIGLGKRIFNATSIFEMSDAYAIVIVVGFIGYGLNKLMLRVEEVFIHWRS